MMQKLVKCMEHLQAEFINEWNTSFFAKTKQSKKQKKEKRKN